MDWSRIYFLPKQHDELWDFFGISREKVIQNFALNRITVFNSGILGRSGR